MRPRWIHFGYIHAPLPLSDAERREVEKRANRYANRRLWFVLIMIPATIALPLSVIIGGTWAARALLTPLRYPALAASAGYLGVCALSVFLYLRFIWTAYRRPTRRALRDLGYDVCVRCGYWLRELGDDVKRCPECGAAREPLPREINPRT